MGAAGAAQLVQALRVLHEEPEKLGERRGILGGREEASRELLRDLLGSDGSLGELSARIVERTGGNPFFTEEVVTALAASGSLLGERGAYRLTTPIETLALPVTVQALLTARIDRRRQTIRAALPDEAPGRR